MELFKGYTASGMFFLDIVAVIPYASVGAPNYIFLRFLKLVNFTQYLGYFTDFVLGFLTIFNNEQQKIFQSLFQLLVQIFFLAHICGCIWILIGETLVTYNEEGVI